MDGLMVQGWLTLGLTTAGTAIHAHGYVRDLLEKRAKDAAAPGDLAPERALVAAFHHIAGCNVSFSAIEDIVARYGIDRESALYLRNQKDLLIDRSDQERFDWYYGDLQEHARRLNSERQTAERYLAYNEDSKLEGQLKRLIEIGRELQLIQHGGRLRTIKFIAECISGTFAETQAAIGASLDLSISAMSIQSPAPSIRIPEPDISPAIELNKLIDDLDRWGPSGPGVGGPSVGGP
jgi:hypothetical protein